MKRLTHFSLLASLILPPAALAGTIRVPADSPTIQGALDGAAPGETVEVSEGEYAISEPLSFGGKAIILRSTAGASKTTIRMANASDPDRASVVVFESGETEAARIEGFTVMGGRGTRWGNGSQDSGGGGILARNGSRAVVRDCLITENFGRNGGGLMCDTDSSLQVQGCTITLNRASSIGGGMLWRSTGEGPVMEDCLLLRNMAASGGALFCYDGSSPEVRRCRIESNFGDSVAGGLCCLVGNRPRLSACLFIGNYASGGGAISCETDSDNPVFTNCLVVANLAFEGGGLQARDGAAPRLVHCTVTGNGALDSDGGILCPGGAPVFVNSIVLGNEPPSVCGELSSTLTEGQARFVRAGEFVFERFASVNVAGTMTQMPDFVVDPGDYQLSSGSPALDAGQADGASDVDLTGHARPCGPAVDLGAYERCVVAPPAGSFVRGDANDSGRADISDAVYILVSLFAGGETPHCLSSLDANDSGRIDVSDAVYLLSYLFSTGQPLPTPVGECGLDPTADGLTCEQFTQCAT